MMYAFAMPFGYLQVQIISFKYLIMQDLYCSMIHGGLNINLKDSTPWIQACCLRNDKFPITIGNKFWSDPALVPLRNKNLAGEWDPGCRNCYNLEQLGFQSFRQGMNNGLAITGTTALSGPARIDIMFDISCNLACRTCGAHSSTFWQKHLKDIGEWSVPIFTPRKKQDIISSLATLDLSNLKQVVFCGGETLLGQEYWDVARWLTENVPDAKQNLMICFQTNGTQSIHEKNYDVIDACHLVKLHISIDGVGERFEYLRWPAQWSHVTENIDRLKSDLPGNVMFLIEQTISIFNVLSIDQVDQWVRENFATNRELDPVECTRHMAVGEFGLENCSQELADVLIKKGMGKVLNRGWSENPDKIKKMLGTIKKFDQLRKQSFEQTFPEVFTTLKAHW